MTEPWASRWSRRAKTIPMMLVATVLALVGLPLIVAAAVIVDAVRFKFRFPTLRLYGFVLQYLINDSIEIVLAPVLWLLAGVGTRLQSEASIRRHERLQWWSIGLLQRRAEQLLGLRIDIEANDAAFGDGPIIVISRHVSLFDASLPAIVFQPQGFRVKGVIMAELLADPGFDLLYPRLGSAFIPRDQTTEALEAIRTMTGAATATNNSAFVIFPEGRLFRPSVRDRELARLSQSDNQRTQRLAGLTNLLPPRPGGVLALLASLPEADVVLVHHVGFERFPSLASLAAAVPISRPIRVELRRIARSEVPTGSDAQLRWLDDLWLQLDRDLTRELA